MIIALCILGYFVIGYFAALLLRFLSERFDLDVNDPAHLGLAVFLWPVVFLTLLGFAIVFVSCISCEYVGQKLFDRGRA